MDRIPSKSHKLLNCSYLRATPKLHWSFQELPRKLHGLHRRILDNATNLYWSSRGQKNESEKIGKGELLQSERNEQLVFLQEQLAAGTIKSRKNTKTMENNETTQNNRLDLKSWCSNRVFSSKIHTTYLLHWKKSNLTIQAK